MTSGITKSAISQAIPGTTRTADAARLPTEGRRAGSAATKGLPPLEVFVAQRRFEVEQLLELVDDGLVRVDGGCQDRGVDQRALAAAFGPMYPM
jgi:hypothetical protein